MTAISESMEDAEYNKPDIRSKRDLRHLCEVSDLESGRLLRSTFVYVTEDDVVWFGQADGVEKYDLTVECIKKRLNRVADEKIYPNVSPSITTLLTSRNGYYIKRPKLLCLDDEEETKLLPQILLGEAETLEAINRTPHPNLVRYYGCTLKNGRVTGIALEKYEAILQYRYEDDPRHLDIEAVMKGLKAGITHLHSLGLAHNDLNPTNVALDNADNPIILDFGSCKEFGAQLVSAGTPGWIDEDYDTSSPSHDEIALRKIEDWMKTKESERSNNDPQRMTC